MESRLLFKNKLIQLKSQFMTDSYSLIIPYILSYICVDRVAKEYSKTDSNNRALYKNHN